MTTRAQLRKRILEFITGTPLHSEYSQEREQRFNSLALELFAYQFSRNALYQKLCLARNATPAVISRWQDIPSVAAENFKHLDFFCGEPAQAPHVFHTSGTTQSVYGRHYFATLELYRAAALRTFKWACLPDRNDIACLILGPTAEFFPHSSLGHMFSWIRDEYCHETSQVCFTADGIDIRSAVQWLQSTIEAGKPVMILATSLALFDFCRSNTVHRHVLRLPAGSRLVHTGGYKGRKVDVTPAALQELLQTAFALPADWIFNEYGMTELSSQMYESRFTARQFGPGVKVGPPWLRVQACDVHTLAPVQAGQTGVLRFFDLANLDSVAMVQTEDLGRVSGRGLVLQGRAAGAAPRGCSLLADEVREIAGAYE